MNRRKLKRTLVWTLVIFALLLLAAGGVVVRSVAAVRGASRRPAAIPT